MAKKVFKKSMKETDFWCSMLLISVTITGIKTVKGVERFTLRTGPSLLYSVGQIFKGLILGTP